METTKIVKVANGHVEGRVKNILGRDIVQFLCIPYCKPPVGELRFQRPQPCETFSDQIINKLNFETFQPQLFLPFPSESFLSKLITQPPGIEDEDSLYVNIWCPLDILNGSEKQTVFMYIHGGGFVCGTSSMGSYDGSILASQENIIVTSFNYRIGMFGFLCLDDLIKGNMGMWDQILAIKWIYDNISAFNGNQENMTLGGCSAGAASVSLHLLIEESWPHFNKAIIQSGVCLADWSCLPKEELNRRSIICVNRILSKNKFPLEWSTNLPNEEKISIIKYLQNINFKECVKDFEAMFGIIQFAWAPCIDGDLIKDSPMKLFKSGKFTKCPTIIQTTKNEGSLFILSYVPSSDITENHQIIYKQFLKSLEFYPQYPIPCRPSTLKSIKNEYHIRGEALSIEILEKIVADEHFVCPSIELACIVSKFNENVFYVCYNTLCNSIDIPKWVGVFHGSDTIPFFGNYLKPDFESTDSDKEFCKSFMGQYCHFMKNGMFQKRMPYFETNLKRYISIEKEGWIPKIFSDDQWAKVAFWKNLRKTYD